MKAKKANLLQGTLDLLVPKALARRALHGLGVSSHIEQISKGV
jgi:PadR family transcriptional regulator PadR